ncbi:hypothetical protein MBAV_003135 [Candidatus Magnetobacterium bavaricum]|uniref:Uncharacterized protein n=1 Tax=Candidatus Magnetobacterium bavaricum TaxID=29290 RepID=A0A0F3GVG2_9BACT|nr:hypothetical protein MBAV_003135 [Candidatus Magnetobacterium bavaricum]
MWQGRPTPLSRGVAAPPLRENRDPPPPLSFSSPRKERDEVQSCRSRSHLPRPERSSLDPF